MKSADQPTRPSFPHFIEFRLGTDPKHKMKVPIKLVPDSKIGKDNYALFLSEGDKHEIWLSKERNMRQLCRDTEHEMDHQWAAFLHHLHDAYIDWKRIVLED